MSELNKKLKNSIKILHKVNANLSKAFVSGMFKAKTRRYNIKKAVQKYVSNNNIQYVGFENKSTKVYVLGLILTQSHLDILSLLLQKIVHNKEKRSYIVETTISEIAKRTGLRRETVDYYLDDLKIATLKVFENDIEKFTCGIISDKFYITSNNKEIKGIGIVFDPVFVLYFVYRKIWTYKLPEHIQNVILKKLKTGIAKAIARYCFTHEKINKNLFVLLKEIDKEEYCNLKSSQRRKIRYELKKDIKTLKDDLNINIENDNVTFTNPAIIDKDNQLRIFKNNNPALIEFIDFLISDIQHQQAISSNLSNEN